MGQCKNCHFYNGQGCGRRNKKTTPDESCVTFIEAEIVDEQFCKTCWFYVGELDTDDGTFLCSFDMTSYLIRRK
ncbi:MAG: hypothetical protein PHT24_04400 [Endomicrobiaceae bacterium]|jgi:hypothetical protein|nr:hypothetical protein [Endomicrobiaceae bacterium]